jgi:RNA polymerase sigma-70 factor (ECF subfamily)
VSQVETAAPDREVDDETILAAFERRESGREALLYDHLIRVVQATLFRVLGRRESDHDDLVQSVFEQVLITLRRKRFARACSLRSWTASIACNVALNALRARATERKYFERDEELGVRLRAVSGEDDPERSASLSRELEKLRRQLAALNPEQARTLLLHDALGYELAEIAVLTDASIAAAQSRLVRGRKELRARLGGVRAEEES